MFGFEFLAWDWVIQALHKETYAFLLFFISILSSVFEQMIQIYTQFH